MRIFGGKQQAPMRDRVIVFDEDAKTCDIFPVELENEEIVRTATKTFPKADLEQRLSKHGKVFVFRAPSKIVEYTEHLARVEQNTIIRQIAQYSKPVVDTRIDFMKIGLMVGLIIVAIVAATK